MNAIPWKRLVPVFAALALFYALSLVYFSPMLEGKRLDPARHQATGRAWPRRWTSTAPPSSEEAAVDRQHVQRHAGLPDLV